MDYFRQLADGAPVMIWMSGLDMGCFYFNRAWLDFRGRTTEEEYGNGWAKGVHPDDLERCVNHYVGCFERRLAFAMTYRLQDAAGVHRWILDRGAPHFLPDGTFLGFFGGCAEIEVETPIRRNSQLSESLAGMREFARKLAEKERASVAAISSETLRGYAKTLREQHEAQLEYAVKEMDQLAADMQAYGQIGRSTFIP